MPRKVMQYLRILTHQLTVIQTTIYGFNTSGTRPMNKIKLKCQIGDLQPKVMCYVIDADIAYNLLLGHPWIHHNFIIPSTISHVMKYADEEGEIKTLIAEKHPFKRDKNYFTDSLLYQDSREIAENPSPEDPDSGTEADAEPEPDKECL